LIKARLLAFLIELSALGAHKRTITFSTNSLAEQLGVSQQTVSRRLMELEREKLIERRISHRGEDVRLTEKGFEVLRELYLRLKDVVEETKAEFSMEGEVFEGMGEGSYYMSREGYARQFIEKLGFRPYPGTLNLRLISTYDLKMRRQLEAQPGILIKGFEEHGRSFGSVRCFKAVINDEVEGAIILISRTHYDSSVLEVISAENLRKRLKLEDGERVKVRIILDKGA